MIYAINLECCRSHYSSKGKGHQPSCHKYWEEQLKKRYPAVVNCGGRNPWLLFSEHHFPYVWVTANGNYHYYHTSKPYSYYSYPVEPIYEEPIQEYFRASTHGCWKAGKNQEVGIYEKPAYLDLDDLIQLTGIQPDVDNWEPSPW